jgi:hypothetical protein
MRKPEDIVGKDALIQLAFWGYAVMPTAENVRMAARISELEVGLRRAIHLIEVIRPIAMWPLDDDEAIYTDQWASATLALVREALAGSGK